MSIEVKLTELGIALPQPAKAVGSYIPVAVANNVAYVSGQIPVSDGKIQYAGKIPSEISINDGQQAARLCLINALSQLKAEFGSLDKINKIVKLEVFVNSSPKFTEQATIANGASDLLVELFGENGKHARIAVGASELPLNSAVEISLIATIK